MLIVLVAAYPFLRPSEMSISILCWYFTFNIGTFAGMKRMWLKFGFCLKMEWRMLKICSWVCFREDKGVGGITTISKSEEGKLS